MLFISVLATRYSLSYVLAQYIAARTGTKREKAIIGDLFTTDGYSWKLKIEKCIVTKNDKSDKKNPHTDNLYQYYWERSQNIDL